MISYLFKNMYFDLKYILLFDNINGMYTVEYTPLIPLQNISETFPILANSFKLIPNSAHIAKP